jgi:outer membrane protein TolC
MLHAESMLEASLLTQEDAQKMLNTAKELHRVGLSPISDVYSSAATFTEMQMAVVQNRKDMQIQKAKLLTTLGLATSHSLELVKIETLPQPPKEQTQELIALAMRQHTELLAKRAQLKEAKANQEVAECHYLPKLTFGAKGGLQHYAHDETKAATYDLLLDLKVPLFSGFDSIYRNRMAYSDTQVTIEELAELELAIALEVLSSQRELEAAVEMRQLAEENVQNALLAYNGTLEKYKAGKEDMLVQVSQALQQLAGARVRLSEVKTTWLVSLAKLGFATGSLKDHV